MKPLLRHNSSLLILSVIFFSITLSPSTSAQTLTRSGAPALNDWHSVQSLTARTRIRLTTGKKKTACFIDSVTEDHLICSLSSSKAGSQTSYAKEEIKEIKLTNRSRSTVIGTAVGGGIGAGVGALVAVAINSSEKNQNSICCRNSDAALAGGAVIGAAGAITGAALGYAKDWFAGPIVYRRP